MFNYTIIIPHKNIPDLLQRCLDSIPRREDVQIIVVDDNSDITPEINDKNVTVLFVKEGKGAGYARNAGLQKAEGKWLMFADADDYFNDGFLRYTDTYLDSDYDLIYFGINDSEQVYDRLMRDVINSHNHDDYKYNAYVPYGKMIKHSLITQNQITFDETRVANDRMFSLKTAYAARNIFFDENKIYTYDSRPGSLVSVYTTDAALDRLNVYLRQNTFLESIGKSKYKTNFISYIKQKIQWYNPKVMIAIGRLLRKNNINLFREFCSFYLNK